MSPIALTPGEESIVRRLAIRGGSDAVRQLLLSGHASSILRWLVVGGVDTATELAKAKGITLSNASQQLAQLWRRGYLSRVEEPDPSGGKLYRYSFVYIPLEPIQGRHPEAFA